MRFETAHLAFDLPDGYRINDADACFSFVHDDLHREITVATMTAKEEADVDGVVRRLADHRLEAFTRAGAAAHSTPVVMEDRGPLRQSSFLAVGDDPLVSFNGNVIDTRPLLGQRPVVMFCCYQYFKPGAGPPNVAAFEASCREILATVVPVPNREALDRATADGPTEKGTVKDSSRLYPYPVPRGYVDADAQLQGANLPSFGHDLYLAIAEDFDGAAAIHFPETLPAVGDRASVVDLARRNLSRAASEQRVTIRGFEGPRGHVVMLFGFEWLAASCLFLPNLYDFAKQTLRSDGPFCVSIPHREAMFVFRDLDASYRSEMRAFIAENEKEGRKPLTGQLFRLGASGEPPVAVLD